jgi:hypothetical protein
MAATTRGLEFLVGSAALGAVLWSASTACHVGSSPTSPPACAANAPVLTCVGMTLTVSADGPYTFTFQGATYSGSGNSTFTLVNLAQGRNEISGRMNTANVGFGIAGRSSSVPGAVEQLSVQSVQGPFLATPTRCAVYYGATGSMPPPQDFRFQFTVGTTPPLC